MSASLFGRFLLLAALLFAHDPIEGLQRVVDDTRSNVGNSRIPSRSHRCHVTRPHMRWMRSVTAPRWIHHPRGSLSVVHSTAGVIVRPLRRIAWLHSVTSGVRMGCRLVGSPGVTGPGRSLVGGSHVSSRVRWHSSHRGMLLGMAAGWQRD